MGDIPATAPDPGADSQQGMNQPDPGQGNQPVLQSDGTYAPAPDGSGAQPAPQDAQNNYQNNGMNGGPGCGPPRLRAIRMGSRDPAVSL